MQLDGAIRSHRTYKLDPRDAWVHAYVFYFSTLPGCVGAMMASAAYAHGADGVVFDPQDRAIMTVAAAVERVRDAEIEIPKLDDLF